MSGLVQRFGDFHFFAQLITTDNIVWLHNGIETKEYCQYVGNLDTDDLYWMPEVVFEQIAGNIITSRPCSHCIWGDWSRIW